MAEAAASISGWGALDAAVAKARAEVAAAAPDAAIAAEGDAYVMRVLTTCMTDAFLGHLMIEDGLSRALPTRGGPNPDYRMAFAPLDPAGCYRIEGRLNGSERVGIGTYSFGAGGSAEISAYAAFDDGSVDGDGRFHLDIAANAEEPGGLPLLPGARALTVRILHRDPSAAPARVTLQGRPPFRDLALATGSTEGALQQVAQALTNSIRTFLEWSAVTSAARNCFHAETPAMTQGVQGDPDTVYFLGSFDLGNGEWLEVTLPEMRDGYWSLHAYNHWCEALPGAGIGDDRASSGADGAIRIAIGPALPLETPNRIDTLGRHRGALIARFIGAEAIGAPVTMLHSARAKAPR